MKISICIPQYNRVEYLLKGLDSICEQDYVETEVAISDDCSTDDSASVIPAYIARQQGKTHVQFRYIRQPKNLGYDGNLRAAMRLATGDYVFVLGNDDALSGARAISTLAAEIEGLKWPDAAFCNYHPYGAPELVSKRAPATEVLGTGPETALRMYRRFCCVSGVIFKRSAFERHDTSAYDGSIYVQIYLACRIIAAGGTGATIAAPLLAQNVTLPGRQVNSYLDSLAAGNRTLQPKTGGLDQVGKVACDGMWPYIPDEDRPRYALEVYRQILSYSYPIWLYDYRKHGVLRASVNMALGCFPSRLVLVKPLPIGVRLRLLCHYFAGTAAGLLVPVGLLDKVVPFLRRRPRTIG